MIYIGLEMKLYRYQRVGPSVISEKSTEATEELISSFGLGAKISGSSRPSPPLTPPISPISSRNPVERALSLADTTEEIAHLRNSLEDRQSEIRTLQIKLEDAENEFRQLREDRREAANEHLCAVLEDREEEIEKSRRREERLKKMLTDKETMIKELETSIDEGKERENDLRRKLEEANRRVESSEHCSRATGDYIPQDENTRAEKKRTVQKSGSTGLRKNRLEIRRHKGDRVTPIKEIYQVVAKGASFEKV